MARLSLAAVLLIVTVPLCMYTGALFVGIHLGRALERSPADSVNFFISLRGVVDYFAKELWDTEWRGSRDERSRVLETGALHPVRAFVRPRDTTTAYDRRPRIDHQRISSSESSTAVVPTKQQPARRSTYTSNGRRNYTSVVDHARVPFSQTLPSGVISVGPWGGSGGTPFLMLHGRTSVYDHQRLRSIVVYHSSVIHSLACEYAYSSAGPWGLPHSFGSIGARAEIKLSAGEHLTAVEGSVGRFRNVPGVVITSLTFRTSTGRVYGPYGGVTKGDGTRFSVPAVTGGSIVGFWGRSGWLLDAVGVYIKPLPAVPVSTNAATLTSV